MKTFYLRTSGLFLVLAGLLLMLLNVCYGQTVPADSTSLIPNFNIINGVSLYEVVAILVGIIEVVFRILPTTTKFTPLTFIVTILQRLFWNGTNVKTK